MVTQNWKHVKCAFNILFILLMLAGGMGGTSSPVQAAQAEDAPVLLQFTSGGHALGFTADGMYAATGSHALHVDFAGANAVVPQADMPASPSTSLRTGADGKAASLSRVTYADLWEGVTLTYTATADSIYTTTYNLAPGVNPNSIRLRYNAPLTLNDDGTLRIAFETGALTESSPIAWQEIQGKHVSVNVSFCVRGQEVTFALGRYNPRYALTIDPSLTWNTFLGGSGTDYGNDIAVDGLGNVYVAGRSNADWGSPVRPYTSGEDAFAAKLDSSGNLTWNTFLGGSGDDLGVDIAVDGSGNVYVAGGSDATWGSPVRAYTGGGDAFAAKLSSSGALTWNTFLGGGSGYQYGRGIAVDGSGKVYVQGDSDVTWGNPVRAYTDACDAFVAKLDSSGALTWNTFLGGSGDDRGYGIAVDGVGNVYAAGYSTATWGSPVRPYTSGEDAFAAKLSSSGALTWNTFLSGSGDDWGFGIAVDGGGNVYVGGFSNATWGSPVRAYTGGSDAFAAKLSSSGALTWNTFLGGSGTDRGYDIAVDGGGNVYVAGGSTATWGSPVRAYTGGEDAFAAKLSSYGALTWNTFLGGSGYDAGFDIAVDGGGNVYVTGDSDGSWGNPVRAYTGGTDAFAAKLNFTPSFADVAEDYWAWTWIERLYNAGITIGCGTNPLIYCPEQSVTRAQMAKFLEKGMRGSAYTPPPGSGTVFVDVPLYYWAVDWIEKLYADSITKGCSASPLTYCPDNSVTRAEMALFLLRAKHGAEYTPPTATGIFADVPTTHWAANWIEQLYAEGITTGCGGGNYCPDASVTRAEMAKFLVLTFNLP